MKFDKEYLETVTERGKNVDLLAKSIDFSKLFCYFPIHETLKLHMLYTLASQANDNGLDILRELLLLSGQYVVAQYIDDELYDNCNSYKDAENVLTTRVIIPTHIRNWLMFKITLNCGLIPLMWEYDVITDYQFEILFDDNILECNRIDTLLSDFVPNMSLVQYYNFKQALCDNMQHHIANCLP